MWWAILAVVSAVIGTAAGAIANKKAQDQNAQSVEDTNQMNLQIARENLDAQAAENEKNRQFNAQQAEVSFLREAQYNSPIEQVRRYREAGINPSVAFSGNTNVVNSSPTALYSNGLSPSLPSMIPYQAPTSSPFNIATGISDGTMKVAKAIEAIQSSRVSDSKKREIDEMLKANLRNLSAQAQGQELSNTFLAIYGDQIHKADLKEKLAEVALTSARVLTEANNKDYVKAKSELAHVEKLLRESETRESGERAQLLKQQNETFFTELKARLENLEAQTSAAQAEAAFKRQELLTSEAQREKFVQETLEALESTMSVHLDNEKRKKLMPLIEHQLQNDIRQQGQDYWNPFRYVGTLLGGAAGASIRALAK